jgi:hypothetical protein
VGLVVPPGARTERRRLPVGGAVDVRKIYYRSHL